MKKFLLSFSALFLLFGTTFAMVEVDSIFLNATASEKLDSISYLITQTPLTQIKEERASGVDYWINPLRNISRMLRSINTNKARPTKTIEWLNDYIDGKLYELNTTGKIAVYGRNLNTMAFFLRQSPFYWGGSK